MQYALQVFQAVCDFCAVSTCVHEMCSTTTTLQPTDTVILLEVLLLSTRVDAGPSHPCAHGDQQVAIILFVRVSLLHRPADWVTARLRLGASYARCLCSPSRLNCPSHSACAMLFSKSHSFPCLRQSPGAAAEKKLQAAGRQHSQFLGLRRLLQLLKPQLVVVACEGKSSGTGTAQDNREVQASKSSQWPHRVLLLCIQPDLHIHVKSRS